MLFRYNDQMITEDDFLQLDENDQEKALENWLKDNYEEDQLNGNDIRDILDAEVSTYSSEKVRENVSQNHEGIRYRKKDNA